jgi:hypothetical protein
MQGVIAQESPARQQEEATEEEQKGKEETTEERGPSEILPWLYLGSRWDYINARTREKLGITWVLNVVGGRYPSDIPSDQFEMLPLSDFGTDKLSQKLPKCFDFLQRAKQSKEKVLVHCQMGVNRSTTVVIAYLVKHEGYTLKEAAEHVKKRRGMANPHKLYLRQLRQLEEEWLGKVTLTEEEEERLFYFRFFA